METNEEVTTHILKGKRTKRQRVQSLFPFVSTTNSPIEDEGCGNNLIGDKKVIDSDNVSSPISTNSNYLEDGSKIQVKDQNQEQEDIEEDMANCLILLSQGGYSKETANQYQNNVQSIGSNIRFTSKKFLETGSNASGKLGYYVYECKTCYKTFPSFQALGGHRASHKKPKAIINNNYNDEKHYIKPALSFDDEDGYYKNISSLSLQLSYDINNNNNRATNNNNNNFMNNNKAKMHECATCGAEFTSGQALGGHMRRHRITPIVGVSSSTNLFLTSPLIEPLEVEEEKRGRDELSLSLDLNLPAPEEDKFSFPLKEKNQPQQQQEQQQQQQQQQDNKLSLSFSNPALIDCHY